MLTLEIAIQKIQQFLDFSANKATTTTALNSSDAEAAFFELAGICENKDITAESLRAEAWRETK